MAHYASRGRCTSPTPATSGRASRTNMGHAHERARYPRGRIDRRRLQQEIDRLNARAQHLRAERGELGDHEIPLPGVHYGLREGDLIAFTAQHRPSAQPRVENGTRGQVSAIHERSVTVTIDGSQRRVQLAGEDVESLRLAYAQHVYRQQGATVERSVVLTGGWQTSKETAYVEATRARHGTTWFIAREDLGEEGQDAGRITRLAQKMVDSAYPDTLARLPGAPQSRLGTEPQPPAASLRPLAYTLADPHAQSRYVRPQRGPRTLTDAV